MLKAPGPPGALALLPLTVLFVSVTTSPGAELRMPPNASLGVPVVLFPLTVLFVSVTVLPQQRFAMPPTTVSKGTFAPAVFPLTVLLARVKLAPCSFRMPPATLRNDATVALFPLIVLFVSASVPSFKIPPASGPLPRVIVRSLIATVFPTSTVSTVPDP